MNTLSKVGCFICNFNKKDYVIGCAESLLKQSYKDIDIYVVDNASTDGSAAALNEKFGDKVSVYVNESNLGGSGGFGRGIKLALENGYEYAVLLDNDVRVDEHAIETMLSFMEQNKDIGILGPKVLQMANPTRIQDMGGSITREYYMYGNYWGYEDIDIPDVVDSDYVSTCTAMLRMEAVRIFGSMPEENFIYWDDVELSKKCQLAGYRTVAIGNARVWHNMQTNNDTPFNKYYLTRNRFKFFSMYLDEDKLEEFKEWIFLDTFNRHFMYKYKGMEGISRTFVNALEDFIDGKYGKAGDGRLVDQEPVKPMLVEVLRGHKQIFVRADLNNGEHRAILNRIRNLADEDAIIQVGREFCNDDTYMKIGVCSHVKDVKENPLPVIMTDRYMHCICTDEQFEILQSFDAQYKDFRDKYWSRFSEAVAELRKRRG